MRLTARIHILISKVKGLRRIVAFFNSVKINSFKKIEDQRKESDPANLRNFEKKIYSQNGEDGIIEEIFNRIGITNRFFVEFGVENGTECNTRHLLEDLGWSGLWMDGSVENMNEAAHQFAASPLKTQATFITAENIVELFRENEVPEDLDLLSIDIDGNDYWILKALKGYRPRLLIVEYNASFLPGEEWIMPYKADHVFDGSNRFGVSLSSLEDLAQAQGYRLVACDGAGVNAFFVRDDLLGECFTHIGEGADYHYCSPKYNRMFFGHRPHI